MRENISDAISVRSIRFAGDDEMLTKALQTGQRCAQEELFHRYARHVRGVLVRVLGTNVDVADHLHNTFVQVFSSIDSLREGRCLKQWLTTIAVYTAISHIKSTARKRWLTFVEPEHIPELEFESAGDIEREAVRQVYEVLSQMKAEDRAVFCLRVIDGMPLKELADVFGVSLATIKRRVGHAQTRFQFLSRSNPVLVEWMQSSSDLTFEKHDTQSRQHAVLKSTG